MSPCPQAVQLLLPPATCLFSSAGRATDALISPPDLQLMPFEVLIGRI
jgi:hypothetical protein